MKNQKLDYLKNVHINCFCLGKMVFGHFETRWHLAEKMSMHCSHYHETGNLHDNMSSLFRYWLLFFGKEFRGPFFSFQQFQTVLFKGNKVALFQLLFLDQKNWWSLSRLDFCWVVQTSWSWRNCFFVTIAYHVKSCCLFIFGKECSSLPEIIK